ncbi:IS110 family transposase [Desulfovirgula thermocuniculi]|uniref:IS110 family transposase n=1 Tax=Desulfovirgula thermocuniculi TaxID=348842 RepID=UPI00040C7CA3|nr:transposase [Desulfovirgula thermocuniculi]
MSVIYVGIDVGKRKHEASFIDETGKQLGGSLVFDNSPQGVEKLLRRVASLGASEVVYGLEATGHYWLPL